MMPPPTMIDLANLPDPVQAVAQDLIHELAAHRLEVILVPAPNPRHCGHQIRMPVAHNPDWYRTLCQRRSSRAHPHRTRPDTAIKRQHVVRGLTAIAVGKRGPYYDLLLPLVQAKAAP